MQGTTGTQVKARRLCGRLHSLASWRRPSSFRDVAVFHLPLALLSGIALVLPYGVPLERLPSIPCTFLSWTGYPCPFCGFTRSFWAIASGRWQFALANCPLAFPAFLAVFLVFAWNASALFSGVIVSRGPMLELTVPLRRKIIIVAVTLFTLNWAYRLLTGLT